MSRAAWVFCVCGHLESWHNIGAKEEICRGCDAWGKEDCECNQFIPRKGKVMFLTSKKATEWQAGKWKYTYTNFKPKTKQLLCFSGDYLYVIRLMGAPKEISFNDVPEGYKEHLNPEKALYRTKASLIRTVKRNLATRRKKNG